MDDSPGTLNTIGQLDEAQTRRSPRLPLWTRALLWVGAIVVLSIAITSFTSVPGGTVIAALILGSLILRVGWFVLQQLATPPPPPPDPGTLRKVKLTYRCSLCGTEVRMTAATDEDPEPPRHCMEDMELVAPLYD